MKLSLFTPTHRPAYLREVYESLVRQGGEVPFEWVIVINGGVQLADIHVDVRTDPHIRIIPAPADIKGIGALKRFACEQCKGDVFVELDHDDALAPIAFEELAEAYKQEPNGFYYSDFINIKPGGTCQTFSRFAGWQHYYCNISNRQYTACSAFEPSARSLCEIFFAPNHVRAWSREAYARSGGHDSTMFIGDDHDLCCRTYIADVPFVHIKKPLYFYRCTATQSFREFNEDVQIQQAANKNKYLNDLIMAECRRTNKFALDIGRIECCSKGYEGHDIVARGFQFEGLLANSIGCVRAVDCLQRVPKAKIIQVMNDIYRLLAPGGWLTAATPSIVDADGHTGFGTLQDSTMQSYWDAKNFDYFTQAKHAASLSGYTGRFQAVRLFTHYPTEQHKQTATPYVVADLSTLKDQRQPGEQHI